jgi:murein DD-endopeptidase MepM/ murein hydrolase activator NlpD
MQIIVLRSRFSAKPITLEAPHLLLIFFLFIVSVFLAAAALYYWTLRYAVRFDLPLVQNVVMTATQAETTRQDRYVKQNLAAMATKLGQMQAQLMRLDALGERVQGLAGIRPEEFNFKELPGRGGAEPSPGASHEFTLGEFQSALDELATAVEHRSDYMNVVETALMEDKVKAKLLPTIQPVNVAYNASSFGWRVDPFTGNQAFHPGIDFAAPIGTPIVAAAGGVVIAAEYHHEYGNMLEIDHGNDLVTRYGHTSKLYVKVGDIVRRGQHVADIGSTGRSTGPHLHFEVLVKGVPQNPSKFLNAGARQADNSLAAR